MRPTIQVVAAALINHRRQIMVARRAAHDTYAGQWEFPGGKIEPQETPLQALFREIQEELGWTPSTAVSLGQLTHSYQPFDVELELFMVPWSGQPLVLVDHSEVRWLEVDQLAGMDLAPADLPFIPRIKAYVNQLPVDK